jgi:hypothetical protein
LDRIVRVTLDLLDLGEVEIIIIITLIRKMSVPLALDNRRRTASSALFWICFLVRVVREQLVRLWFGRLWESAGWGGKDFFLNIRETDRETHTERERERERDRETERERESDQEKRMREEVVTMREGTDDEVETPPRGANPPPRDESSEFVNLFAIPGNGFPPFNPATPPSTGGPMVFNALGAVRSGAEVASKLFDFFFLFFFESLFPSNISTSCFAFAFFSSAPSWRRDQIRLDEEGVPSTLTLPWPHSLILREGPSGDGV